MRFSRFIILAITLGMHIPTHTNFMANFFGYKHSDELHKEYTVQSDIVPLVVDHTLQGNLTITGWPQKKVAINATRKAKKEDDLSTMAVEIRKRKNGTIRVTTGYAHDTEAHKACELDIEIFVPQKSSIIVQSTTNVDVYNMQGSLNLTTEKGAIATNTTKGKLYAQVTEAGNIAVHHADGDIQALTGYGNIVIEESKKSVHAHTESGTITLTCAQVPSTCKINLDTKKKGLISLTLPDDVHATIAGSTQHGKILSDIPITLEPFTTVLNKKTYNQIPRSVRGTIGESGGSDIQLASAHGIRIKPRAEEIEA